MRDNSWCKQCMSPHVNAELQGLFCLVGPHLLVPTRCTPGDPCNMLERGFAACLAARPKSTMPPRNVITENLSGQGYHRCEYDPLDRAEHSGYPNPHNYQVLVSNAKDVGSRRCPCEVGCKWDPVTGQAEVRCRCGRSEADEAYYPGEWQDNKKIYIRDE